MRFFYPVCDQHRRQRRRDLWRLVAVFICTIVGVTAGALLFSYGWSREDPVAFVAGLTVWAVILGGETIFHHRVSTRKSQPFRTAVGLCIDCKRKQWEKT